jgi:uncharacterized membrane protein
MRPGGHQSSTVISAEYKWAGPLPTPQALAGFERALPGSAERIVAMTEREQAHRHQFENKGLTATISDTRRGHYLGATISLVAIAGAIWAALSGAPWQVVIALVGVPVAAMVQAMVTPRRASESDEKENPSHPSTPPDSTKKPERSTKHSRKRSRR